MKRLLLCTLWVCLCYSLNATSIIPYNNLGELSDVSDLIAMVRVVQEREVVYHDKTRFHYDIVVEEFIKGNSNSSLISIQRYKLQKNGLERKVFGDLDLEIGQSYLLFLNHLYDDVYRPQVMNYYVFEEVIHQDKYLLVPTVESAHLQVLKNDQIEPLKIYEKSRLISHLKAVSLGIESWSKKKVVSEFQHLETNLRNEQPGHCNNYYDKNPSRWNLFEEGRSLPIYIDADFDEQKKHCSDLVENAIGALQNGYENTSLDLRYAGIKDFNPCTSGAWYDNSANGYFFQQWADTAIGQESVHIMFNDPCGELPPFTCGKKGTIAFGGLYRTLAETHEHEGQEWFNGYLGFVLVAKGAGCVSDSRYESILMHEITHALSLGHIHGAGTALMNPGCCMPITALDRQCMSSLYYMGRVKIEEHEDEKPIDTTEVFVTLTGHSIGMTNQVKFSTKKKSNWGEFIIERSGDGVNFSTIETILKGDYHDHTHNITSQDRHPLPGPNHYRITMIYDNGLSAFSETLTIENHEEPVLSIHPNPVERNGLLEINIKGYSGQQGQLSIFDLTGRVLSLQNLRLSQDRLQIRQETDTLKPGAYYVVWKSDQQTISQKMIKA